MTRGFNAKFSVHHLPGCGWLAPEAPQIGRSPASWRGFTVRLHELDDGVTAIVCSCGARSFWRGDEELPDRDEEVRQASERDSLQSALMDDPERGESDELHPLTRRQVLDARRRWQQGEGHRWTNAAVSKATYMRARHKHNLVPWPLDYRDKLTP